MTIPFLYQKYKYAMRFLLIMAVCVALSMWLSRYIDARYFDNVITPALVSCSTLIAFVGSWMVFRHADGLRVRKVWGWTLLAWGVGDGLYVVCWLIVPNVVMNMGAYQLTTHELLIGNLLGWLLLLYPTEALRPGWMNWRRAEMATAMVGREQADENLRVMREKYDNQLCTMTDLLDAQSQWQQARSNLIEAQTQLKIYEMEYLCVTGRLE
ncbi:MAG: TolC family protein [Bacteroidaceae bacterium]|nr:TolC family protein [Bacteroidaceae bacterium]